MLLLLACAPHATSVPAPPADVAPEPERVQERDVVLDPAVAERGCDRLDPSLWALAATSQPVQVVLEITAPTLLPKLFEVEAETATAVQGVVPGDYLCTLAALGTVTRVRKPLVASPKAEP